MKVVVKLGGSSLVKDKKRDSTNYGAIKSLTDDLIAFHKDVQPQMAIITGGGYAHSLVEQYNSGFLKDYKKIHEYVENLRKAVATPLINNGLVLDVYSTFEHYRHAEHKNVNEYLNYLWQLTVRKRTFELGHIWNSCGDIGLTPREEKPFRIISGDDLTIYMAEKIGAERIIFVMGAEGIYRDFNDKSSLIKKMYAAQINEIKFFDVGDQTGGLEEKIKKSQNALKKGIRIYFVNSDNFLDALYDKDVPTLILP